MERFFRSVAQMNTKTLLVIVLAVLLFGAYVFFFRNPEGFKLDIDIPGPAPEQEQPPPHLPGRVIAPGGPNSPAQQGDVDEPPALLPEPTPSDPFAEQHQSSAFGDENRAPEKLFGPAPLPTVTDIAVGSGIASHALSPFQPAVEQFNPETAQNGGEFMRGGIFAYDKDVPTNYSEF